MVRTAVLRVTCLILFLTLASCVTAPTPTPTPSPTPSDPTAAQPAAPAPLPLWPEITHGTLANGLQYYVLKHGKPEKRAFLWLAVNAGSMAEDEDQRGLAHFVEHMAFNGTARYPKSEIVNTLEKMGMRFGADLNAYTKADETVYQLEVPTDLPGAVSTGLDILHEWSSAVTFDPDEVEKERGVVLEELRLGTGVMRRVFDKHFEVELANTRYAVRQPIGLSSVLRQAPRERLVSFYKDWYRPDLMAVIVVGDVEPGQLEKELIAKFSDLKAPDAVRARPVGGVPANDGPRVSIQADPELSATWVQVINLVPHRAELTREDARRGLVENLYQLMFNDRLRRLSNRAEAPFSSASVSISGPNRESDALHRSATVKGGKVQAALQAVIVESRRVETLGFGQAEFERALAQLKRQIVQDDLEADNANSRQWADELTRNFFEAEQVTGRAAEKALALEVFPTITLAELNATGAQFGGAGNRVVLISGPDAAALPTKEQVLAFTAKAEAQTVEPWKDSEAIVSLFKVLPTPGSITAQTHNAAVGTTEWTLSNGVHVIVKPTTFAKDSVSLAALSPGGLAMATDAQFNDARFANTLVSVGGAGEYPDDAIRQFLAGKTVQVGTSIDATTESISGSASVGDLETMFALLHLKVTQPRRDDALIEVARANLAEQLREARRSPHYQFTLQSTQAYNQGHPRTAAPTEQDVQRIDVARSFAFFNDRFGDLGDFTFVIVGSASLEQLKPLVERYLASLPSKGRKETERDVGVRPVKGVVIKRFPLEKEAKAQVSLRFHGDEAWSRDKDRDLFGLGQVLNLRLRELLREDLGGVYGVGAGGSISRRRWEGYSFGISYGCAPERVDALVKATFDEVSAIAKKGIGEAYLEKVKLGFVRGRETELMTNGFWLTHLLRSAQYGDDPAIVLDPTLVTRRVTSANIQAAAKRYLEGKQYYQAVLLPAP